MIVSMIRDLGRRMGTQSENLKVLTELKNVKESQMESSNKKYKNRNNPNE